LWKQMPSRKAGTEQAQAQALALALALARTPLIANSLQLDNRLRL
jgi:hypothetical protein